MATLQKFRLLATQCAVAGSPTRSPSTSPVIQLRRRKTLRMLLSGSGGRGRRFCRGGNESPDRHRTVQDSPEEGKEIVVSHKLKDLFVSSPPSLEDKASDGGIRDGVEKEEEEEQRFLPATGPSRRVIGRRGGARSLRPLSAAFRQRLLLRRAWRPVLVTIPE